MKMFVNLAIISFYFSQVFGTGFDGHEGLTNVLLREMVARMGNDLVDPSRDYVDLPQERLPLSIDGISPRGMSDSPMDYEDTLGMSPSLRDREYMAHSSLLGSLMGSYGYDDFLHRMKTPNGVKSMSMKPEGVLPAYCTPPNPCPVGYTSEDGCLEEFENTAGFSRDYQSMQECMCDTEHMFRCPDSTPDSEITAIARSIQNDGVLDSTFSKIMSQMNENPFLAGEKLPIAAKKGVKW